MVLFKKTFLIYLQHFVAYELNVSLRIVSHNSHMHEVLPGPRKE